MKKIIFFILVFIAGSSFADAKVYPRAGETAATFLKIGVGSRALGMGGAFTAVADDASGFIWNPAGSAGINDIKITASHNRWFEDIYHEFIGGSLRYKDVGVFSAGVIILHMGRITSTLETEDGLYSGEGDKFIVRDLAVIAGYAKRINHRLLLGANVKIINQKNADVKGIGFGIDMGAIYMPLDKLRLGMSIKNIGPNIKINNHKFPLPLMFNIGASYIPFENAIVSLDFKKPVDNFLKVSIGGEWVWMDIISARAGYEYDFSGNRIRGIHLGGGLEWRKIKIDYAYLPFKIISATHRFSVSYGF